MTINPKILLFDIGGVLVNWDGISPLIELTNGRLTPEQARKFWLDSPWVRKFEAGLCTPDEFASGAVKELAVQITSDDFLARFISWDRGPLPGAVELLAELRSRYTLACLSNNNALHWAELRGSGLLERFQFQFVSFEIHKVKPDREVFEHVIAQLKAPASDILFFDDNIECIEAAKQCGMQAAQTKGVEGVQAALKTLGLNQ